MKKFSIKEIASGTYLTDEANDKYTFGKEEDRIIFYDEADAENVLECLNDETDLCCVLLDETNKEAYEAFEQLVNERKQQGIVLCIVGEEYFDDDSPLWDTVSEYADISSCRVCYWVHENVSEEAVIKKFEQEKAPDHVFPIHVWIDADPDEAWWGYCNMSMEGVEEYRNFPVWL